MDIAATEIPLRTLDAEPAELGKCAPVELYTFFHDLAHFDDEGWIARRGRPKHAWAAVDLDKYQSLAQYIGCCRRVHSGNAIRDAIKAERLGYYSKFFDLRSYVPDMAAIDMSTPARGGEPMSPYYQRTIEARGGYPTQVEAERVPGQAASWVRQFGLFRKFEGYRQGEAISDEQLMAYATFRRYGDFAFYGAFIGHADHLADGIMYRTHLELVASLLAARSTDSRPDGASDCLKGIRYIGYGAFFAIRPGLLTWKKRMLFEPFYLQFDYLAPAYVGPLCTAAEFDDSGSQGEFARLLTVAAEECRSTGKSEEAAQAEAALAAMSVSGVRAGLKGRNRRISLSSDAGDIRGLTAVFHGAAPREEVVDHILSAFAGDEAAHRLVFFSTMGTSLDLADLQSKDLHVMAGLDARFGRVILSKLPIYATEFALCWLASLLADLGPGGELWVEIPNDAGNAESHQITMQILQERFGAANVERDGDWVRVAFSPMVTEVVSTSRTVYRCLHKSFDDFRLAYLTASGAKGSEGAALSSYVYSLNGVMQRQFILERICETIGLIDSTSLLDVGGGMGFLAVEWACHQNHAAILEPGEEWLQVARWLARRSGVEAEMSIIAGKMQELAKLGGQYDLVTFFNSFYYCDKAEAGDVLRAAYRLVTPGGALIIWELPKELVSPMSTAYNIAWSHTEFEALLKEGGYQATYWDPFQGAVMGQTPQAGHMIIAAIAKPR